MAPTTPQRAGTIAPVPTGTLLVRNIGTLATLNEDMGELKDGFILCKGNTIEAVGLDKDLTPEQIDSADRVVSLEGCVVVPGLVNTHAHHFQSLTRCIAQDKQLHGWLCTLYPVWAQMTSDDLYIATKLALVELIMSGCTTTSDHAYIFPNDCKLDDTVRAARDLGVRFHAVRGGMSAGISKGGIAPDSVVEEEDAILKDAERCILEMHDNNRLSMLRMAIGPSSQKVVTDSLMADAAKLARRYPGVRLHTHLAENVQDIGFIQKGRGPNYRFKNYITSVGWDKADCWFAHCCMLNDEEQDLFAERGIGIAHCPSSNTRLASGILPVRKLLDKKVNVGVGVDGAASNDCQNLLAEARLAMLLQRAGGDPTALSAREALRMATKGGAFNLGRQTEIGEIAPGFAADFVAWRVDGNLGFAGAGADPIAALLLCAPSVGWVDFNCINGRIIVENGKLQTADMTEVVKSANKAAARLHEWVTKEALGAAGYVQAPRTAEVV